ncbi:MAG: PQQ-binding-like beta-propeller repeat protein [Planctomycetaceae bacterium]
MLPNPDELARYGLQRVWWNRAVIDGSGEQVQNISADELGVYVQANSGVISAFDAETGRLMWARLIGAPGRCGLSARVERQHAVPDGRHEDVRDRQVERRDALGYPTAPPPSASPEVDEDHAYIGTVDGSVYAFKLARVKELYDRRMLPQYIDLALLWRYQAPRKSSRRRCPMARPWCSRVSAGCSFQSPRRTAA